MFKSFSVYKDFQPQQEKLDIIMCWSGINACAIIQWKTVAKLYYKPNITVTLHQPHWPVLHSQDSKCIKKHILLF